MNPLEREDDKDAETDFDICHTSYERRPEHEAMLSSIFQMKSHELLRSLPVTRHTEPDFIASEVLVTLARANYGSTHKVRDAIGLALTERVVKGLTQFLFRNPEWYAVVSRSSEAKKEAVSFTLMQLFATDAEVSFAEVTFLHFMNMRFLDWFRSQTRLKNEAPSVDGIKKPEDEEGASLSLVDQVVDEDSLPPDKLAELNQLIDRSQAAVLKLPRKERDAIYFCLECEFTQKQAAEYLKCTERSVHAYLKSALARLRKGDWHE